MQLRSLCRDAEIGANSYLIEAVGTRIVLDCGMHPKKEGRESTPRFSLLEDDSVDAVIISHSHLDHIGTLPVLLRNQANARVFCSEGTRELGIALLHNSVNVMQSKRSELGITEYPLFSHRELDDVERRMETRPNQHIFSPNSTKSVEIIFYDAGHILGSNAIALRSEGHTVLYSGDINFADSTLIKGASLPEEGIDTLIIETTHGATPPDPDYTRESEERAFAEAISETLSRGGSALVPVFSNGKTQEILTVIHKAKLAGRIPQKTPVIIGGLSIKMTTIYDRYAKNGRSRAYPDFKILKDMDLNLGKRGRAIVPQPGAIFCLSSGMITEKTTSYNFLKAGFLENSRNSILFVGYADPDSPAGHIRPAEQGATLQLGKEKFRTKLRADKKVFNFSGHANRDDILNYILRINASQVFLVHGDHEAKEWFVEQLAKKAPGMKLVIPQPEEYHTLV